MIETDTVVQISQEQYEELIGYLHTLNVTGENVVGALGALFAVLIVLAVFTVLWDTIRSITQYI